MDTKDTLLGQRFDHRHAAGVTRYQIDRAHRDAGYYECVSVRGVSGTHHFIGGIQVFSRADILAHPVHEISAWTGKPEDESPLCGLDKDNPHVWGYRTVETGMVTCQECLAIREQWADLHDVFGRDRRESLPVHRGGW